MNCTVYSVQYRYLICLGPLGASAELKQYSTGTWMRIRSNAQFAANICMHIFRSRKSAEIVEKERYLNGL